MTDSPLRYCVNLLASWRDGGPQVVAIRRDMSFRSGEREMPMSATCVYCGMSEEEMGTPHRHSECKERLIRKNRALREVCRVALFAHDQSGCKDSCWFPADVMRAVLASA